MSICLVYSYLFIFFSIFFLWVCMFQFLITV